MQAIVDLTNSKGAGTFKFQYSNHFPVRPNPGFIPKEKRLAEKILGYYFCEFRKKDFARQISEFRPNDDDSNRKPDVLFIEDGVSKGLQITQLQFTIHQARKAATRQKSKELADQIARRISFAQQNYHQYISWQHQGRYSSHERKKRENQDRKIADRFYTDSIGK